MSRKSSNGARRFGAHGMAVMVGCQLLCGAALAADFPKSGQAWFDRYLTGKTLASADTPIGNAELWQEIAVTRNVKGDAPFDRLDDVCLGQDTFVDGKATRLFGTCVKTDKDGDKILVTFGEDKGHWSIVGGTGKFKGITGTGTSGAYELVRDQPKEWSGVARETIQWRIN